VKLNITYHQIIFPVTYMMYYFEACPPFCKYIWHQVLLTIILIIIHL